MSHGLCESIPPYELFECCRALTALFFMPEIKVTESDNQRNH